MVEEARKGFFVALLMGNTLREVMTLYRLRRQHARSTKRPSKFQLLKIIGKTKSVTYRFYFFVRNLPKFFNLLESVTKRYIEKRHIIVYRKLYEIDFRETFLFKLPS